MLGNATLDAFSHIALKDQLVSMWTMKGTNCYHGIPKGRYPTGSTKSISLFLSLSYTNPCKSPLLPKANSHSSASNRVGFVARLSGCVSVLHHISRDGERKREREGAATLSFPLGYKAAHHWPARLVVRGKWDTMEAFVPCHLAIRHSLIHGGSWWGKGVGGLQIKDGESLKTEGVRECRVGGSGECLLREVMMMHGDIRGNAPRLSPPALSSLFYRSIS